MRISDSQSINNIQLVEQTSNPATPAAGFKRFFVKADGMYVIDSAEIVTGPLGAIGTLNTPLKISAGGGSSFASRDTEIVFARTDFPAEYLNKITSSASGSAGDSSIVFEVCDGGPTSFFVPLALSGNGVGFYGVTPVAQAAALSMEDTSNLDTGDATSDAVIDNMRIRIAELETIIRNLGLSA